MTRARPPSCFAVLLFRAQRLRGPLVSRPATAPDVSAPRPDGTLRPGPHPARPAAPAPLADMSEAKNGPEYATFFGVMGATSAMIFSGERRRRGGSGSGLGGPPGRRRKPCRVRE